MISYKAIGVVLILLLLLFSSSIAQKSAVNTAFISVQSGGYLFDEDSVEEVYDSKTFPVFGAAVGFPFGKKLYLHGKLSYSFKNSSDENEIDIWITNVGLKYPLLAKEKYSIELSGGFSRAGVKEKTQNSNGTYSTSEGIGIFGAFYGVGVERKFSSLPFTINLEVSRNTSFEDLKALTTELDGTSFSAGLRYYLPPPKKQH